MPAKDTYHDVVKNALIKDGWTITADPYPIKYEEIKLVADLAGEKTISASREGEKIVIEIKSFTSRSPMREFETALGQYLIYQTFLSITHPDRKVYLAVGNNIYGRFFQQIAIELILQKYQILLLVVDLKKEEIVKWIS
ncbi:XisH family protein [Limnofasciculus baicalensis]|uniref:XisH family protein n=1 Tax=Limnofasciculus baicalensis BBK-W-15 TaxID=2699891 RepID=A0AAE3KNW4_9CYAN|nr:XisH family protein [Limnofasciculus baicalensis]MCP2730950.1 XisH family protein [Limnofasciculus baicalensis BBK-W-15]